MRSAREGAGVSICLSEDEALVLFDWLARLSEEDAFSFCDQAEERVVFDLEATLEKAVSVSFRSDYEEILSEARENVRDQIST